MAVLPLEDHVFVVPAIKPHVNEQVELRDGMWKA
jgi:hypothetical protein